MYVIIRSAIGDHIITKSLFQLSFTNFEWIEFKCTHSGKRRIQEWNGRCFNSKLIFRYDGGPTFQHRVGITTVICEQFSRSVDFGICFPLLSSSSSSPLLLLLLSLLFHVWFRCMQCATFGQRTLYSVKYVAEIPSSLLTHCAQCFVYCTVCWLIHIYVCSFEYVYVCACIFEWLSVLFSLWGWSCCYTITDTEKLSQRDTKRQQR